MNVLVTGASGGIGEAIATNLVAAGASVTLVARPGERLEQAARRLGGRALAYDLSLQQQVLALGAQVTTPLEVLVLNAALMPGARRLTIEGIEETLAVNHLAPFLLVQLLRPLLRRGSRVVVVGADPRLLAREPVDLDDLQLEQHYAPTRAYMRTKNMNAMFTYALARRLAADGVTVNAGHPGVIRTSLGRNATGWMRGLLTVMKPFLPTAQAGADTPTWLATSPDLAATSGQFFVKRRAVQTAAHTLDLERQEALWAQSAKLVGLAG